MEPRYEFDPHEAEKFISEKLPRIKRLAENLAGRYSL
jgi:hypothetical protein